MTDGSEDWTLSYIAHPHHDAAMPFRSLSSPHTAAPAHHRLMPRPETRDRLNFLNIRPDACRRLNVSNPRAKVRDGLNFLNIRAKACRDVDALNVRPKTRRRLNFLNIRASRQAACPPRPYRLAIVA